MTASVCDLERAEAGALEGHGGHCAGLLGSRAVRMTDVCYRLAEEVHERRLHDVRAGLQRRLVGRRWVLKSMSVFAMSASSILTAARSSSPRSGRGARRPPRGGSCARRCARATPSSCRGSCPARVRSVAAQRGGRRPPRGGRRCRAGRAGACRRRRPGRCRGALAGDVDLAARRPGRAARDDGRCRPGRRRRRPSVRRRVGLACPRRRSGRRSRRWPPA